MANVIRLKRASGSDPAASDLVSGEPAVRTDTGELFFKKDDGSVAKVSGAGGGPDFKYLALRNAANNGAASYPNADFTLVTSGTTNALTPTAANTLLVSVNGVIQKPNTGTSTPSSGFALSGSTIKFGGNISAAPDFILYQESGGIGEPSDATVSEAKLQVSNNPVNGYFLSAQSGNTGGLTWAAPVATSCTGNSATATALATARAINGVNFDGTAAITVTAAAGTLSGNTLNSSVTASSLTSLGDLAGLTVNGNIAVSGTVDGVDIAALSTTVGTKLANIVEDTSPQLGGDLDCNNKNISLNDSTGGTNNRIKIGTHDDLQLWHNSSTGNSNVSNYNGDLYIQGNNGSGTGVNQIAIKSNAAVELNYQGNKKFETTSTGGKLTSSATTNGSIIFDVLSGIRGYVYADNANNIGFLDTDADWLVKGTKDAGVELHYNGNKKFETVTGGATITGVCTATSFAGDGSALTGISAGATGGGSDEVFYENSTTVTTSYSITSNKNAMSAGPLSINSGAVVTIPSGSVWTIV